MKDKAQNEAKELTAVDLQRRVIRQLLEDEITSLTKSIDRDVKDELFNAAAHDSARRDGISWALFVLSEKIGV